MSLTLKNIVVNTCYYVATAILLPAGFLRLEKHLGAASYSSTPWAGIAIIVIFIGVMLQAWCILLFQRVGRGTPSPAIPPQQLVKTGPYRWVRNPMNWGELLVFVGLASWFGSPLLLAYAVLAWVTFHTFIVKWEEPRLIRAFGADYTQYRDTVPRWLPKIRMHAHERPNRD